MKRNCKKILLSLCVLALSLTLIAGVTFAIFESENKIRIPVTSGEINITAKTTVTGAWSAEWVDGDYENHDLAISDDGSAEFTCGGKVFYDTTEKALKLDKIVPGDGVQLKVELTNASTIKTKYNVSVSSKGDSALAKALKIEIDGSNLTGEVVENGWRTADIPANGSASLGYATVKISLPMAEGADEYQGMSCELAVAVNAVQFNAHIEVETGDVILNSNFVNKVNNAIASANVQSAPAIVFGAWGDYQDAVTVSDDYAAYEDGIAIPGEINAKIFRVEDQTRMFRAVALEEENTGIGMDALYVLAGNSITAAENGEESFTFADSEYIYVDMSGVDFSKTTSLGDMFSNSQIQTLIMQGADLSKVTDLESMFSGCTALTKVDFTKANLSSLTSIWNEFKAKKISDRVYESNNLESVNFSGANLSGLTTLEGAFAYNIKLTDVNFSGAILSKVEGMGAMFRSCTKLVSADFSEAKLPELISMASTDQGQALPNWGDGTYDVGMFDGCYALTDVSFADAEFGKLKDMANLFHNCVAMETFSFSEVFSNCNLSTVTDIHHMFYYNIDPKYVEEDPSLATHLKSVDLSGMQFTSVEYVGGLFHGCSALETADFTGADLSGVTDTGTGMFLGCDSVEEVILKDAKLGPAICSELLVGVGESFETLDFSGADFEKVTDMARMFAGADGVPNTTLKSISFKGAKNLNNVTNMFQMFLHCTELVSVDFTDCNLSKVTNIAAMFQGCTSLKEVDFTGVNLSGVEGQSGAGGTGMANLFDGCTSLESVSFARAILSNVQNVSQMFNHSGVQTVDFTEVHLESVPSSSFSNIFSGANSLTTVIFKEAHLEGLTSLSNLFCYDYMGSYRAQNVETVDFSEADLSGVTAMYAMFYQCSKLTSVDFSGADLHSLVGKTADLYSGVARMFEGCTSLTSVDFTEVDLSGLVSMQYMFGNASRTTSLVTANFSGADLRSVTSMSSLFKGFDKLTTVDFSGAIVSSVTDLLSMFDGCSLITSVDLSSFDFSNVTTMNNMFQKCAELVAVDMGAFNVTPSKSCKAQFMFNGCAKLKYIYVNAEMDVASALGSSTTGMFQGCTSLPNFSALETGKTRAYTSSYGSGYLTVGSLKVDGIPEN